MLDPRPVGYVIGLLILALGLTMTAPALVDASYGNPNWRAFALSGGVTVFVGGALAGVCLERRQTGLSVQQAFMLTVGSWLVLPVFGALPFLFGAPGVRFVDGFFESMSGLTTTGSTVFTDLQKLPPGANLWRAMLQWFGGVGIVVFAMAFLPTLRVGGMQLFKSESFDTFGKILPRAAEIAQQIGLVYLGLTAACIVCYAASGMNAINALVHAMTTISTGGFSTSDLSFAAHESTAAEYFAVIFMILAALPFVRYVQIVAGTAKPLLRDPQIHAFLGTLAIVVLILSAYRTLSEGRMTEEMFRDNLFNLTSILTGTGYASADYERWGPFSTALFFIIGLVGGCAGSTSCSIKVFRYQVLYAAVTTQIRRLHSPHGVFAPRFAGRPIEDDVISSIMAFLFFFFISLAAGAVTLSMMGLAPITAITGAATAIANVGPGLGPEIGPTGNFQSLPDAAKWVLSALMLMGRLELLAVLVLFTPIFWRG